MFRKERKIMPHAIIYREFPSWMQRPSIYLQAGNRGC
jgi:hypothetical protein